MITVLIGQRGVGKTTFLGRIVRSYRRHDKEAIVFDLDQQIERMTSRRIADLFINAGEAEFRRLENKIFFELFDQIKNSPQDVFIALGAGFEFEIPNKIKILWLRRVSDQYGRIFLDRPRLNPDQTALDEFFLRANVRHSRFQSLAHEQLFLSEGAVQDDALDDFFLGFGQNQISGTLTLQSWMLSTDYLKKRIENWGVRYFEVRDDILNSTKIDTAQTLIPRHQLLISIRNNSFQGPTVQSVQADYALELGSPPASATIVSLHERSAFLKDDFLLLKSFEDRQLHCKYAPLINSLHELWQGHQWWKEHPDRRSFLPRSKTGDWSWYRALYGPKMELGFFSEDKTLQPDQPVLSDWFYQNDFDQFFAAILGDPVELSWTPSEQREFFGQYKMPIVRIRLQKEAANFESLGILKNLGLIAAAVTAPLKTQFSANQPINTLAWDFVKGCWHTQNTDIWGLKAALSDVASQGLEIKQWVVWGGGGILPTIHQQLPTAILFSARTGQTRVAAEGAWRNCDGLIWAAGHNPPHLVLKKFKPKVILDLNYTENSPARELALSSSARYISGQTFFKVQAKKQREFWQPFLEKRPWIMAAHR